MTSKTMRANPLFMRNNFEQVGKWGIPLVKRQELPNNDIELVACSDTKRKVYTFLLMTIDFREFITIRSEH